MKLKGKTALVTGSGRGIGRAIALALAEEGADVVTNALHKSHCQKVCEEVKEKDRECIAVEADISKKRAVKKMIKKAVKKFGKIDILVNNAGIVHFNPFEKITEKEWKRIINVNLTGTFLVSQTVVGEMLEKDVQGKIINIASIAGYIGFANLAHYCASKGGIIELTKEMAIELAPHKINVNAIGPGVIETDMTKDLLKDEKSRKQFLQNIPLGRFGQPEDIAKVAVFLASEDSDYITGRTLFVDGGWISQ